MWFDNAEKVGRDVGRAAASASTRSACSATDEVSRAVAFEPGCAIYVSSGPKRGAGAAPDYERLLAEGIKRRHERHVHRARSPPRPTRCCESGPRTEYPPLGGASLYVSGNFTGFASDELAGAAHDDVAEHLTCRALYYLPEPPLPRGRRDDGRARLRPLPSTSSRSSPSPADHIHLTIWRGPIELIASGLGVELHQIRGRLERRSTERDLEVVFGIVVWAGTAGVFRTIAAGRGLRSGGIVVDHVIRMALWVAAQLPVLGNDTPSRLRRH